MQMAMDKPTRNTMTSLLNPSIVSMSLFIVVDASVGLSIVEHGIFWLVLGSLDRTKAAMGEDQIFVGKN